MPIRRIQSKWAKTEALIASPDHSDLIPETRRFDRDTLQEMLHRLGMIYIKPVNGTFGRGVIRISYESEQERPYRCQSGEREYDFADYDALYTKLLQLKRPRPYLVQQGIELLRHDGRRFDFRLMVQMNPAGKWESTGLIGRVAHPRKIVTNYHSGGTPKPYASLMTNHLETVGIKPRSFEKQLRLLGIGVAEVLERKFPGLKEIGIDVAIDQELKPWILEVNTLPDPYLFLKLPDRNVYRRIRRYAVAYGRFRPSKRQRKRP